jgi:uncharacterized protein YyaL (SSP411 family)
MVLLFKPAGEKKPPIAQIAPFTASHTSTDGKATAYVCENYTCRLPTTDVGKMMRMLGSGGE